MKKFTAIIVLSFIGIPLYSQIKFIPKAGTSFASIQLSDDLEPDQGDIKSRFGFVAGLGVDIPLWGERISLQSELFFIRRDIIILHPKMVFHSSPIQP